MTQLRVYKSIDTLPMWNYIKVVETGELRYLYVLDYYDELPPQNVDESIWEGICFQYFDTMDSQKSKAYLISYTNILALRKEISVLNDIAFILCYKQSAEIIAIAETIMNKYGVFKFDVLQPYESIFKIEGFSKSLATKYELKVKEFERKYSSKGAKIDFYDVIDALQRHNKIIIDVRAITVRQFIAMSVSMNKEIIKQNGKTRNRRA
jgi:hypothetical protein